MTYDKPITIQKIDDDSEKWVDMWNLHARVNKTTGGEDTSSGATRSVSGLTFEVRYFKALSDISHNVEHYRLIYGDNVFNIVDYDDFMENHKTVKLDGEFLCKI